MNIKMKIYVQVVDTKTGIYQTGMVDEPVIKGSEIDNALRHFGVLYGEVEWVSKYSLSKGYFFNSCKVIMKFFKNRLEVVSSL